MITIEHLTKRFGDRIAVDDVTFRAERHTVTGLLGPNGAGKTTTLRILLGLDSPSSGAALVGGRPLREYRDPLCRVGALLDGRFAHPRRTAFDHLLDIAYTHGLSRARVHEVIDEAGLDSVANRRVGGFSLGMTRRLGIASALLGSPEVLILDEPVNGLDVDGVQWVRRLCREQAEAGKVVLLSSHLMSEIERIADHVVILGRGRILSDSTLDELVTDAGQVTARSDDALALERACTQRGGMVQAEADGVLRITGLNARMVGEVAHQEGIALYHLADERATLEERYLSLTGPDAEFRSLAADRP